MDRRRFRRELELGDHRVDHVLLTFHQVGDHDLVLDELRRFALQLGCVAGQQFLKTLPRFRPVLLQERNLREIEAGVPELRIGLQRLAQRDLRFLVILLPHHDDAAQILRLREVRLARIDCVEILQRLLVVVGVKFPESLVIHRLQLGLGRRDAVRREAN